MAALVGIVLGMAGAPPSGPSAATSSPHPTPPPSTPVRTPPSGWPPPPRVSLLLLASSGIAFAGGLTAAAVVLGLSGLAPAPSGCARRQRPHPRPHRRHRGTLLLFPPADRRRLPLEPGQHRPERLSTASCRWRPLGVAGPRRAAAPRPPGGRLALGDDAARGLGVPVRATRVTAVVLAALLSTAAVTLAGPVGFRRPVRPGARPAPSPAASALFARTCVAIPAAGLVGAALVLGADVLLRAAVPADTAGRRADRSRHQPRRRRLRRRHGRTGPGHHRQPPDRLRIRSRTVFLTTAAALVAVLAGTAVAAVLLGDAKLLLGDVTNWALGRAGPDRVLHPSTPACPRVAAALLAGAALALAGTLVQAVTRNPSPSPASWASPAARRSARSCSSRPSPSPSSWGVAGAAFAGAAPPPPSCSGSRRGRVPADPARPRRLRRPHGDGRPGQPPHHPHRPCSTRHQGAHLVVGSTYGRTSARHGTPRHRPGRGPGGRRRTPHRTRPRLPRRGHPAALGLPLGRGPPGFLVLSVLLSATADAAAGTIGFVGLVAPHAARALVGPAARPARCPSRSSSARSRLHRRPGGPHGDRSPAQLGAGPHDRRDRHAVLPVPAGTQPAVGRSSHRGRTTGPPSGADPPRREPTTGQGARGSGMPPLPPPGGGAEQGWRRGAGRRWRRTPGGGRPAEAAGTAAGAAARLPRRRPGRAGPGRAAGAHPVSGGRTGRGS